VLWTEKRAKERKDGEGEGKRASAAVCCESVLALETRGAAREKGAAAGCITGSLVSFYALPRGYASRDNSWRPVMFHAAHNDTMRTNTTSA